METVLFRIPFTLYFVGIEEVYLEFGRIRYKRFLCVYRKKFTGKDEDDNYIYIKI